MKFDVSNRFLGIVSIQINCYGTFVSDDIVVCFSFRSKVVSAFSFLALHSEQLDFDGGIKDSRSLRSKIKEMDD